MHTRDRSGASPAPVAAQGHHHDRPMDPLHHAGRDDPDHSGVPSLPGEDDAEVALRVEVPGQEIEGLGQRRFLLLPSGPVGLVQLSRQGFGLTWIFREEEAQRAGWRPPSARPRSSAGPG